MDWESTAKPLTPSSGTNSRNMNRRKPLSTSTTTSSYLTKTTIASPTSSTTFPVIFRKSIHPLQGLISTSWPQELQFSTVLKITMSTTSLKSWKGRRILQCQNLKDFKWSRDLKRSTQATISSLFITHGPTAEYIFWGWEKRFFTFIQNKVWRMKTTWP